MLHNLKLTYDHNLATLHPTFNLYKNSFKEFSSQKYSFKKYIF